VYHPLRTRESLGRGSRHRITSLFWEKMVVESMFFESIAVPFHVDDFAMMEEPVKNGRGDDGIPKQFLPVDKAFVRGKDRRASLIAIRNELKEEVGFLAVHRKIADLVHNC